MSYKVKEIQYTLQGEGAQTGRPAVFCRFSGCNLWSGREEDRDTAQCKFCDTDFVGTNGHDGGSFTTADDLAHKIANYWPGNTKHNRYAVFTGGEPLLQLDSKLVEAMHKEAFKVAVETNGTLLAPQGVDWVCVSPKAGVEQILQIGDELKVIHPQEGLDPRSLEYQSFSNLFVQPMDGPNYKESLASCLDFCKNNPAWRLSLQTHKLIGIP